MADFQAHGEYYPEPKDEGPDPDLVAEQRRQDAIDAAHPYNGRVSIIAGAPGGVSGAGGSLSLIGGSDGPGCITSGGRGGSFSIAVGISTHAAGGPIAIPERGNLKAEREERIWIDWLHHFLRGIK